WNRPSLNSTAGSSGRLGGAVGRIQFLTPFQEDDICVARRSVARMVTNDLLAEGCEPRLLVFRKRLGRQFRIQPSERSDLLGAASEQLLNWLRRVTHVLVKPVPVTHKSLHVNQSITFVRK